MVQRSHAKLKKVLKISVNADRPQWDCYDGIAKMVHNTTNHHSFECSPTKLFHGRIPYNALDLQFKKPEKQTEPKYKDLNEILDKTNFGFRGNIISANHKYKAYYDRKVRAKSLEVNDFVFLLDPKYDSQSSKEESKTFPWEKPYNVKKVLSESS